MSEEPETTTSDYWKGHWKDGNTGWHEDEGNEYLLKYVDELTGKRSNVRVFVPLCGKTMDLLWLANQGHTVVGVELVRQAIDSFFTENNLTFMVERFRIAAVSDPVEIYKCNEKMITIFCCDLFALVEDDVGGKFDAIWDRGSLSAIAPSFGDRGQRYAKKMRSLLARDGNYLLENLYYEIDRGMRPPASISDEYLQEMFEEDFTIRQLDVIRFEADPSRHLSFALDKKHYLFKPKE